MLKEEQRVRELQNELIDIGAAIVPLWQKFKTPQDARLRVARVTTDDGQGIVGIRIPPEQ